MTEPDFNFHPDPHETAERRKERFEEHKAKLAADPRWQAISAAIDKEEAELTAWVFAKLETMEAEKRAKQAPNEKEEE
jgi:hypothetical protein